ncbi:probable serine/threonine-protein kinase ifkB [Argiope bruennichi]|uniref:probable serine/threonine-protein kinase ifkB n=1 Tax=Argiope bruennichi TaxID=94029 RepID=UPI00249595D6|nr:probable serine/threonine-protein kinase ifkB [Argiope bruennichi]XP_055952075.1 probable serine/threonine-protein kinase ifkB [Argiope bruennichi]
MEKHEAGRKFSRTVPVIIENHENATKKAKLMVPSNYTAGQLANILRSRMHLLPYHPVYLFLKSKQSPILMSKSIGHLHHKHRDEKGLLRLIHAEQASFGFRGNIRAIRFRQKWIENLHNLLHQDASDDAYSGAPPPYFPLDPPSIMNFGAPPAPLDIDDLNEPANEDIFDYVANVLGNGNDSFHAADGAISESSTSCSSESSTSEDSSESSTLTNFSLPVFPPFATNSTAVGVANSFSTAYSAHLNSCLSPGGADTWLPSPAINSGETSSAVALLENGGEEIGAPDEALPEMYNSVMCGNISSSGLANISANVQHSNGSNSDVSDLIEYLYESDSDFYDSDNDNENDDEDENDDNENDDDNNDADD